MQTNKILMDNTKKLPDCYCKTEDSNIYKLLQLDSKLNQLLNNDLKELNRCLNIDEVNGQTLDLYGDMYGLKRGSNNDDTFRIIIKAHMSALICDGTYQSIMDCLTLLFSCAYADLILSEAFDTPSQDGDNLRVLVERLPFSYINKVGLSQTQVVEFIKKLLPAGVRLNSVSFEGTFEFAENETTVDENAGFGNIGQTVGGYFGAISSSSKTATTAGILGVTEFGDFNLS